VDASAPNTNFGTTNELAADTDPARQSFLRFTVTGLSGKVLSAKIRCYVTDKTDNGPAIYATSNSWSETGITWNNKPAAMGSKLDDKGAITLGSWMEFDVTSAIGTNGTFSFVFLGDSPDMVKCSSREAASNRPSLVVSYDPNASGAVALIMHA